MGVQSYQRKVGMDCWLNQHLFRDKFIFTDNMTQRIELNVEGREDVSLEVQSQFFGNGISHMKNFIKKRVTLSNKWISFNRLLKFKFSKIANEIRKVFIPAIGRGKKILTIFGANKGSCGFRDAYLILATNLWLDFFITKLFTHGVTVFGLFQPDIKSSKVKIQVLSNHNKMKMFIKYFLIILPITSWWNFIIENETKLKQKKILEEPP